MQDLFPQEAGLVVTDFALTPELLAIAIQSTKPHSACPNCGRISDRIHSHYQRVLADLPWQARRVLLRIELRKFRCMNAACPRQIFCERLPHVFASHARTTGNPCRKRAQVLIKILVENGPTPQRLPVNWFPLEGSQTAGGRGWSRWTNTREYVRLIE
ncbi:transposase family protein [Telmatocola sphagniphila]